MTQPAATCSPDTSIAAAAFLMEDHTCGVLPVVDTRRRLVAIVTDRDLLLAAVHTYRSPSSIWVHEAMKTNVAACRPDDDLYAALKTMGAKAVRRLPVVDADKHVIGLLSIDDIVQWGVQPGGLTAASVVEVFERICERRALQEPLQVTKSSSTEGEGYGQNESYRVPRCQ